MYEYPAPPVLVLDPGMARAGIPELCDRLAALLRGYLGVVVLELPGTVAPSMVVVEAIARLRLTARRFGADIRVRDPDDRLGQLLALTGLDGVIAVESAGVPQRKAEQREQPLHVEEVADRTDPAG
ncbi:hypothetical protein ACFFWC_27865 [Plantactinospora siamensis]|uniref:STAS domain-containing protein n=1 Tax=Plantactinospora siamensis TaxID=555372 RepID=A0ABV6NQ90_9ACTN